jgi:hypothetical protein
MPKTKEKRTRDQMLTCLAEAVLNAQRHKRVGDPPKIYSQYIRYALGQFADEEGIRRRSLKAVGKARGEVVHDHSIPHSFILQKLLDLKKVDHKTLEGVIKKYYRIGIITKSEDARLSKIGLRSKMPQGWDENLGDIYERYSKAGIIVHAAKPTQSAGKASSAINSP